VLKLAIDLSEMKHICCVGDSTVMVQAAPAAMDEDVTRYVECR
jgi:hypothetical protein